MCPWVWERTQNWAGNLKTWALAPVLLQLVSWQWQYTPLLWVAGVWKVRMMEKTFSKFPSGSKILWTNSKLKFLQFLARNNRMKLEELKLRVLDIIPLSKSLVDCGIVFKVVSLKLPWFKMVKINPAKFHGIYSQHFNKAFENTWESKGRKQINEHFSSGISLYKRILWVPRNIQFFAS